MKSSSWREGNNESVGGEGIKRDGGTEAAGARRTESRDILAGEELA